MKNTLNSNIFEDKIKLENETFLEISHMQVPCVTKSDTVKEIKRRFLQKTTVYDQVDNVLPYMLNHYYLLLYNCRQTFTELAARSLISSLCQLSSVDQYNFEIVSAICLTTVTRLLVPRTIS